MTQTGAQEAPRLKARVAGLFYLITVVTGFFAELFVRGNLIVSGDPAATAHNILANQTLYRLGFAADIVGAAAYIGVTVLLYELLKPVNRTLSLLAAGFSLVGIAVGATASLGHLAALLILSGTPYLAVFNTGELQALALFVLRLHAQGYLVALVFFGSYEVLLGYLIFKSVFLPRMLGILVGLGGAAFLTYSFAVFVAPAFGIRLANFILALDGIGELSLMLWLLVMGVNARQWYERANRIAA